MNTFLKVVLIFICFVCIWNLSPLPDMIQITHNDTGLSDSFVVSGIAIPMVIVAVLSVLVLLFSLIGAFLVTALVVGVTFLIVGISFFWPALLFIAVVYWLFKQPVKQKV